MRKLQERLLKLLSVEQVFYVSESCVSGNNRYVTLYRNQTDRFRKLVSNSDNYFMEKNNKRGKHGRK